MAETTPPTIVSTSAELLAALNGARGGDVILLADNADAYSFKFAGAGVDWRPAGGVTIASLDPTDPARLEGVKVSGVSGLTFRDVTLAAVAQKGKTIALEIDDSVDVTVENARVTGMAAGPLTGDAPFGGRGISARGVDGFVLRDSVISNVTYGLDVHDSSGVMIADNDFLRIQGDGMRFTEITGVEISENLMMDFYGAATSRTHSDFIQFWTKDTDKPSSGILIDGNLIIANNDRPAQGIFLNNEIVANRDAAAYGMRYQDVTITDNLIFNDAQNTIYVHAAVDVEVSGNAVFNKVDPGDRTKSGATPWVMVLNHSDDVLLKDNIAPRFLVRSATNVIQDNNVKLVYDDRSATEYFRNYFDDLDKWTATPRFEAALRDVGVIGEGEGGDDPDAPPPPPGTRVGHAGVIAISQSGRDAWTYVAFETPLDSAVVVAGPLTDRGPAPAMARVRNVTSLGFEIQIDEWDYLDGAHATETVGWVAIEAGRHVLANGVTIEAGSARADTRGAGVAFAEAYAAAPIVLTQLASAEDRAAAAVRIASVATDSFRFRLQEEQAADNVHAPERVDWIALTPGAGANLAAGRTGTVVGHEGSTINFATPRDPADAVFLATMQTMRGQDPAAVRLDWRTDSAARVFIQEETSADAETDHTGEAVGWLLVADDALIL
jgi:hypothetical protein